MQTLYGIAKFNGGSTADMPELIGERELYINTQQKKLYSSNGVENICLTGEGVIKDVECLFENNSFMINKPVEETTFISLRFKAPQELILTDSPTLILNSKTYTIETGNFVRGEVVICNIDTQTRKAFFRHRVGEEVIELTNIKTFADDSSIKISWDKPVNENLYGYYITYGEHIPSNIDDGTKIKISKDKTSFTINDLVNDKRYFIIITPFTKNQITFKMNYVVDTPFSGYLLSEIPVGTKIYLDNTKQKSFILVDKNYYGKNEVTLLYSKENVIGECQQPTVKPYVYHNTTAYNLCNDELNILIEKGLDLVPINILSQALDEKENNYVPKEIEVQLYCPNIRELNGIVTTSTVGYSQLKNLPPFNIFNETPSNKPSTQRSELLEQIFIRDKSNPTSVYNSFYRVKSDGSITTTGTNITCKVQPLFNLSGNVKIKTDSNKDFVLIMD